jgi:uncharacterized protein (TIGR01777 family)
MQTILITGGTGMIGKSLTAHLTDKGYHVIVLTRRSIPKKITSSKVEYALWNVKKQSLDIEAIQKADHIIHLAGAGVVDKKWTDAYKKAIQESRTESGKLIISALKSNPNKVKSVISISAIGWYGPDSNHMAGAFVETDAAANDFLGTTCQLWEQSIEPLKALNMRLVKLRTGIVLSKKGGALAEFKKPLHLGVATILGSGKQVVSWIHIDDLCRIFIYAIENEQLSGSYNAVAPHPVTNKILVTQLANTMNRKLFVPVKVPAIVLKIMMGDRSIEVLKSATVSCEKIQRAGFTFLYATIDGALRHLCNKLK